LRTTVPEYRLQLFGNSAGIKKKKKISPRGEKVTVQMESERKNEVILFSEGFYQVPPGGWISGLKFLAKYSFGNSTKCLFKESFLRFTILC
jgi:hypothetical protein